MTLSRDLTSWTAGSITPSSIQRMASPSEPSAKRAAAEAGACAVNGAEVVELHSSNGRISGAEVRVDGEVIPVRARAVVNAAGPWVDHVRRLEDPRAGSSVRLSKGAHVLLPLDDAWTAALTIAQDDVRLPATLTDFARHRPRSVLACAAVNQHVGSLAG